MSSVLQFLEGATLHKYWSFAPLWISARQLWFFFWTCKPTHNFCDYLAWLCYAMNFAFLNDPTDATAYLCKNMSMLLSLLLRKLVCIYKHFFAAVPALFTCQIIFSRDVSLKVQKHLAVLSPREVVLCAVGVLCTPCFCSEPLVVGFQGFIATVKALCMAPCHPSRWAGTQVAKSLWCHHTGFRGCSC